MKAILVDDEKHCRDGLSIMLGKYCPQVEIAGEYSSAKDALLGIAEHEPEIIFLDIEMPGMNGFEMLEYCRDYNFDVIFTTAYNEYAIQAIRHSALDYLLKPVNRDELVNAVARARAIKNDTTLSRIDKLLGLMESKKAPGRIALATIDGLVMIDTKDILFCESENNYTRFHLVNNKVILVSKTLKKVEAILENDDSFFRIHHSFIINLAFMERYIRGDGGEVVMAGGKILTVSRINKAAFLDKLEKL